jgi:CheY-like chemotaxis protein
LLQHKGLIVCINSDSRRAEERRLLLEHSGYEVRVAVTAKTGLELFAESPADIALVDYELPAMDGNLLASQMKRVKPNVPVVLFDRHSRWAADDHCSADAIMSEGEPWSIVLDKVNELVKMRGSFFQRWLENWKKRGSPHREDSQVPATSKDDSRSFKNAS